MSNGADLYIASVFEASHCKYEPIFETLVEKDLELIQSENQVQAEEVAHQLVALQIQMDENGYFRDSYNDTNLLWLFGISYCPDIRNMLNADSELEPTQAKFLLKRLAGREYNFERRLQEVSSFEEWTREEREAYFRDKYAQFRRFLQQAIDLNEAIFCSI